MIENIGNTYREVKLRNRVVIDRLYKEIDLIPKKERKDWYPFVRQAYIEMMPEIIDVAKNCKWGWVDPYFIYLCSKFSNLEQRAWDAIRYESVPLYPQFPIFNMFVDFGNPYMKIGVEVDGNYYHQDKEKDRQRDLFFAKAGWRIFRVPESEVLVERQYIEDFSNKKDIESWLCNSIDGLIHSIFHIYFQYEPEKCMYYKEMLVSLEKHRIIPFDVRPEISSCAEIYA